MPSIFPDSVYGGVTVRDNAGEPTVPENVLGVYNPESEFTFTGGLPTAFPFDCGARPSPSQINAIVSELIAFAEFLDPDGVWDMAALNNLATAFEAFMDAGGFLTAGNEAWDGVNGLGDNIASAATVDLQAATGNQVTITGTTTITAITLDEGKRRWVRFAGILTLTHGVSLALPTATNITTAAGDFAMFVGYSGGVVRCASYQRADGKPLASLGVLVGDSPTWTGSHTFDETITLAVAKMLRWGTTAASPMLKRSGTQVQVRLSDDSAGGDLSARKLEVTSQATIPLQALTDAANIDWNADNGAKAKVTLGGNRTMNAVTNAVEGTTYLLWAIQDATGSRTLSWATSGAGSFDFGADGAPTLTTTANKVDLLAFEAVTIGGTLKLRFAGIRKGFA